MDLIKKIERELKELEETEKLILLLPQVQKNHMERLDIIKTALTSLTEYERKVIQRTCIDGVYANSLEKEFGHSYKKIYLDKKEALKKLVRLIYGLELWENDNKNMK